MNKGKSDSSSEKEKHMIPNVNKVGELYPSTTLEEYSRSCKDRNCEYDYHDDYHNVGKVGDNDNDDDDGGDNDEEEDSDGNDGKTKDEEEEHNSQRDHSVSQSLWIFSSCVPNTWGRR